MGGFWQMYGVLVVVGVVALVCGAHAWLHARRVRGTEADRVLDRYRLPVIRRPGKQESPAEEEMRKRVGIIRLDRPEEIAELMASLPEKAASRAGRFASWRRASRRPPRA